MQGVHLIPFPHIAVDCVELRIDAVEFHKHHLRGTWNCPSPRPYLQAVGKFHLRGGIPEQFIIFFKVGTLPVFTPHVGAYEDKTVAIFFSQRPGLGRQDGIYSTYLMTYLPARLRQEADTVGGPGCRLLLCSL